jgi:hypothetical protein
MFTGELACMVLLEQAKNISCESSCMACKKKPHYEKNLCAKRKLNTQMDRYDG